ncbi:MAG: glutamyl-tRNA reductase [Chitinophagales bacterium]|nr:glutamyl-tRNA reductase [Chitinophagales bacterium]
MEKYQTRLVVAGVNYRKTALEIRSKFALTTEHVKSIYADVEFILPGDFFILSTCNRTEIYCTTNQPQQLLNVFSRYSNATPEETEEYTFVKTGDEAIHHLYRVASGLDSQILGDYEIIGQLKNAFALAKAHKRAGGYLEKLVNGSLQASRQVRNRTSVSDGTTSVSYAVIRLLKQKLAESESANICLMGMGKFGELTLRNLQHYLPQHRLTVINRNEERAQQVSEKYAVPYVKMEQCNEVLRQSDIVVVATGADHPIVTKAQIENSPVRMVFDLSVPSNVSADVKQLQNVEFYDIDSLSEIINETLTRRTNEVPFALEIIDEHIREFKEWEARRALYVPVLN